MFLKNSPENVDLVQICICEREINNILTFDCRKIVIPLKMKACQFFVTLSF